MECKARHHLHRVLLVHVMIFGLIVKEIVRDQAEKGSAQIHCADIPDLKTDPEDTAAEVPRREVRV